MAFCCGQTAQRRLLGRRKIYLDSDRLSQTELTRRQLISVWSTSSNALQQARAFTEAVDISGLVLTKLDGTAKGGIVLGVSHELSIPVKYIGLGEDIESLQVFDKEAFVYALFGK